MLKFKQARAVFVILLILLFVLYQMNKLPFWPMLVLGVLYAGIVIYGSMTISSQFHMPTICAAETHKKVVALTFDDGPHPKNTKKILKVLQDNGVKAAFFCIGKRVEKHPEIAKELINQGHLIGGHTYSHNYAHFFWTNKLKKELNRAHEVIFEKTSRSIRFFRPPSGATSPKLKRAVNSFDYKVIGWSVRTFDTQVEDVDRLMEHAKKRIHPGAIILMHDVQPHLAPFLERLLKYLEEHHYTVERLDKMIGEEAYA